MEQFYIPSLFTGLWRFVLFLLFIYALNRLTGNRSGILSGSIYADFIFYLCAAIVLSFILIQINSFDKFTVLVLIFGYITLRSLNFNWKKPYERQFQVLKERFLLFFLRLTDSNSSSVRDLKTNFFQKSKINFFLKKGVQKETILRIGIPAALFFLAYFSRVFYVIVDSYTFSDVWYSDLGILKAFGRQNWLSNPDIMSGEYAVMNLYKLITGISSSLALHTFGFLESALLTVSIFWSTSKLTHTRWIPGLTAALCFIFLYGFFLLDVSMINQHRSVFLALTIALPVFAITMRPDDLLVGPKSARFSKILLLFAGLAFTDLFVTMIVVPVFFTAAFLFVPKTVRSFLISGLKAYAISVVGVYGIHAWANYNSGGSFFEFLNSNLYSVSSYTYLPHLILSQETFLVYIQIFSLLLLLLFLFLWSRDKSKWFELLVLSFLFFVLIQFQNIDQLFFDRDLLYQVLTVLIPVSFGVFVWMLYWGTKTVLRLNRQWSFSVSLLFITIFLGTPLFYQQLIPFQNSRKNLVIEEVLNAYNKIESSYLPYSYAIVNHSTGAPISVDSHFFITYNYFNDEYLELDSNYSRHRKDKAFLRQNPDSILPKSTFLFLYNTEAVLNKKNTIDKQQQDKARENLDVLKKREREVKLFLDSRYLQVYEILNDPDAGNVTDLLSKNNSRESL